VTLDTVRGVARALAGKIVWDATNALKPDMSWSARQDQSYLALEK
jgi:hypothetical protein